MAFPGQAFLPLRQEHILSQILRLNPNSPTHTASGLFFKKHLRDNLKAAGLNIYEDRQLVQRMTGRVTDKDHFRARVKQEVVDNIAVEGVWARENIEHTLDCMVVYICKFICLQYGPMWWDPAAAAALKRLDKGGDTSVEGETGQTHAAIETRKRKRQGEPLVGQETEDVQFLGQATLTTPAVMHIEWINSNFEVMSAQTGDVEPPAGLRTLQGLTELVLRDVGVFVPFKNLAFFAQVGKKKSVLALGSDQRVAHWAKTFKPRAEAKSARLWVVSAQSAGKESEEYVKAIRNRIAELDTAMA